MITRAPGGSSERESTPSIGQLSSGEAARRATVLVMLTIGLMIGLTWLFNLERTLPEVRTPRTDGSSQVLSGHRLMSPGYHNISSVDADLKGDWLMQEVGESEWLATEASGSRIRAAFYGTELYLLARVGPDGGRAYVTVNNRPATILPMDETGSYTSLWAPQAANRPVRVVTGLAHGEHVVGLRAAGDGEVAIAGFDVVAQTPFPWAFVLGYIGLAGGLFLVLRQLLYTLSRQRASIIPGSPRITRDSR
jgi:hypothetical protein